jgi:multidrug resistance efflux pump
VQREEEQASAQKTQTAISLGTTVLGALFGRKTLSTSTLGRATTAARGMSRASKEAQDVSRAKDNVSSVQAQIGDLEASLQAEIAALEATYHPATEPLETISLKPKRTGIHVQLVALVWVA